jgi:diguanylate cyclase (GGDEF)-like protein
MDALLPMLLLCAVLLLVAAGALSSYDLTQRTYRGFQWWTCAVWLNAIGTGAIAYAADTPAAWPSLQLLLLPWSLLVLLGLRRFHARTGLPGSAGVDLGLMAGLPAIALLTLQWSPQASDLAPLVAASAALLYSAAVVWSVTPGPDAPGLRLLGALWLLVALLPALASSTLPPPQTLLLQVCVVALGSLAMSFIVLTLSSQRTERDLRQSRQRLRVLANIDMLTQVPNRRRFEELARRALQSEEAGSAALLLVDIDHFKQINDKLGHAAGDRALKLVSRCTLELLRSQDVAGRHGGDEFVMLLRRSSTHEAMQVAERLVSHLQTQAHAHALPRLTLSFGIVQMRRGETIDETLQRADLALYEAKRLGRSRAVTADGDPERPVFRSSQRLGLTSL